MCIRDSFAIEAEGGGGWMMTRYKEYIPYEGHHLYAVSYTHLDVYKRQVQHAARFQG